MRKPIRAVTVPVVIVTAMDGAAGYAAQSSGSVRRLDQRAQSRTAPAPTGRGGGSSGSCNPESIVQRESKGDPNAVNPSSGAGGKYQVLPSTWSGYGGYSQGTDESVQDERFNEMWAGGAGSPHWGC
jgi:Transglycosylase-like domain